MKTSRIISLLLVVALIAFFSVAYYVQHHQTETVSVHRMHPALVVDLHNNGLIMLEDLNKGEDAILVIQPQSTHDTTKEIIGDLDMLQRFDTNHDHRIDIKDPIFARLGLLFFPGDVKKQKYVLFKEAGIKAVIFDQENIEKLPKSLEEIHHVIAGHVEMTDGTTRKINVLPVGY